MIAAAVVLILVPASAAAQTIDQTMCMSQNRDIQIKGCTAVIRSGTEARLQLAIAYSNRGAAYADKGLYGKAIADLNKAIALDPDDADAYNGRAWTYHLMGDDAKALPDVEKAMALVPDTPDTVETRAEIFEKLGRRGKAIADYRATLELALPGSQAAKDALKGLKRLGANP
ncbi:MAG: tetratricopeptide repeat protein [Rhizomicrobium sp.]|jgi:tetratricopeptide (TPR) repeat protein